MFSLLSAAPLLAWCQVPDSVKASGFRIATFAWPPTQLYTGATGVFWQRYRHTWEVGGHWERGFADDYLQYGLKLGARFYPARKVQSSRAYMQACLYLNRLRHQKLSAAFTQNQTTGIGLLAGYGVTVQLRKQLLLDFSLQIGPTLNSGTSRVPEDKSAPAVYFLIHPQVMLSYQLSGRR